MNRDVLRDDQRERITSLLSGKVDNPERSAGDDRLLVEDVLHVARTLARLADKVR